MLWHHQAAAAVVDPAQIDALCDEALDAAGFLRDHVVQAQLNDRGNYSMHRLVKCCVRLHQQSRAAIVIHHWLLHALSFLRHATRDPACGYCSRTA